MFQNITELEISFKDREILDEDITIDELKLTTDDAFNNSISLSELQKRYRKVRGTLLDTSRNRKGFGLTEGALKFMVDNFQKTKTEPDLHNYFRDHDYGKVDSMMGRITDLRFDSKKKRVRYTAVLDLRHQTSQRIDMFKNVSATIAHGDPICSVCEKEWGTCSHYGTDEAYPRSTKAIHLETSTVTLPAYQSAKRDALSVFASFVNTPTSADSTKNVTFVGVVEENEKKTDKKEVEVKHEEKEKPEKKTKEAEADKTITEAETKKLDVKEESVKPKELTELEEKEFNELKKKIDKVKKLIETAIDANII